MSEPSSKASAPHIPLLAIGLTPTIHEVVDPVLQAAEVRAVPFDLEKLMEPLTPLPPLILIGTPPADIALIEVAQLLRGVYPESLIYLVVEGKTGLDRKNAIKNGLSDAFFLPFERENLTTLLREKMVQLGSSERVFRKVQILDLSPETVLNFNTYLYLPANRKHVKFSSAGDSLDQSRVDRLKQHAVGALAIPVEEMKEFYNYTAKSLKKISQGAGLSETERKERLESTMRELITGLFDDTATSTEAGKATVADMQNVVKSYITDAGAKGNGWYNRFLAATASSGGSYSRASAISSYAALFAIGLDIPEVEDVALAGLLHDLGMTTVPAAVLATPSEQWLQADRDIYEDHPEATLRIIRERKLVVSELIYKIILQHHEKFNGSGFPKRLSGDRICVGAQLLAISDALYDATVPEEGKRTPTAREVLEKMTRFAAENPALAPFHPDLLKKICRLFGV